MVRSRKSSPEPPDRQSTVGASAILPTTPLLITSHKDEFDRIRDALDDEIKPRGILEQIYVEDIAYLVWEILRLRRCRAGIINSAFRTALGSVLARVSCEPGRTMSDQEASSNRCVIGSRTRMSKNKSPTCSEALSWTSPPLKREAIRKSADDLERIDRLMASAEMRRDKALACVAQYRGDFGALLRDSSNRLAGKKLCNSKMPEQTAKVRSLNAGQANTQDPTAKPTCIEHGNGKTDCREPAKCAKEHRTAFARWQETIAPESYRHGLSYGVAGAAAFARDVEALAQKIAGRGADAVTLEIARSVARAEFELAQIRRVRVALIAGMSEFGEFDVPTNF